MEFRVATNKKNGYLFLNYLGGTTEERVFVAFLIQ